MRVPTPVSAAPVFRNQQVVGSSPTAGSKNTQHIDTVSPTLPLWSRWRGAYQGAYRRLLRWIGLRPTVLSRLSEAEDIASEKAYQRLVRRLRG